MSVCRGVCVVYAGVYLVDVCWREKCECLYIYYVWVEKCGRVNGSMR